MYKRLETKMRFKRVCHNCGYMDFDNNTYCKICNYPFTSISLIDGIKLNKMNRNHRIEWIEKRIGHSIPQKNCL